jgi:cysteine desulfurase
MAAPRGRHVIVSAIEHPAILESAAFLGRIGFEVTELGVDDDGLVGPDELAAALRDDTTVVSIQLANNEVGTVQPVADLAAIARDRGVPFHTDAVQAAGWLDVDVERLGVQAMSISGHKLGAPKGVGVLYVQRRTPIEPLIHGGGQESGRRSGTENVASAVGMAAALGVAGPSLPHGLRPREVPPGSGTEVAEVASRRDAFIKQVLDAVPGAELTGHTTHRLPGHASFVLPGRSGESVLLDLERRGIVCSSGSACAAGSDEPSHVLTAMGYDREVAQTAVRFTFGRSTTEDDLRTAASALAEAAAA